jgi:uncharacterized protein (DUF2147 family)
MRVIGTEWIWGLSQSGAGEWKGGSIIDPEHGKMYICEITFHPAGTRARRRTFTTDTLEMRGKVGPFGRSQFWEKATRQEVEAIR